MKKLLYILVLVVMACGVVCCNRYGETEARLVAIDSLVCGQPDSALSLLADINGDSLPTDLQAYHSLLTVQALYKAYIPATSDTLIRRAWDYYRDHGPYDRRIRAMLYMGTVAEELGHPDSAMRWYKRTELESRPDDHYHRGYALEQIAFLYQGVYDTERAIRKYKLSLNDLILIPDTPNVIYCGLRLCQIFSLSSIDSTLQYGEFVKSYTKPSNQKHYSVEVSKIIGSYLFYDKKYSQAKDTLLYVVNNTNEISNDIWYRLALSYAQLNQLDSAKYYFKKAADLLNIGDSLLFYQCLSVQNKLENNIDKSIYYEKLSNDIAADEMVKSHKNILQQIEFEQEKQYRDNKQRNLIQTILFVFSIIVIISGIIFYCVYRKRRNKFEQEISALQDFTDKLQSMNDNLQSELADLVNKQSKTDEGTLNQEMIVNLSEAFRLILTQIRKSTKNEKELKILDETIKNTLTPSYFNYLRRFVDYAYSGLATSMETSGKLTDKEINVICLHLCRLPNTVLRVYTGYASTQNTIRYRNNIAKKYFGSKDALENLVHEKSSLNS